MYLRHLIGDIMSACFLKHKELPIFEVGSLKSQSKMKEAGLAVAGEKLPYQVILANLFFQFQ